MIAPRALAFALALIAPPATAEVLPVPGPGDPHLQALAYDPAQVVGLRVAPGFALTVLLAADERIETVTVGDSTGWQVTADRRADRLVVKSQGRPPPTNLTVLTDQRAYAFTLYTASPGDDAPPYLVSFTYPAAAQPAAALIPARWRLHGARALWPQTLADTATGLALVWPAGTPIPAIYSEEDGHLRLVNAAMRDGAYVIEGQPRRLVFVAGDARARADRQDAPAP